MNDLQRFRDAQKREFQTALSEIQTGRKRSHWMWYIFPQIHGLGFSSMSAYYAIRNLEEARSYLQDPYLGGNLRRISRALLEQESRDPHRIFGSPDDLKLLSSMTLFEEAAGRGDVFTEVIDEFYDGHRDQNTLDILKKEKSDPETSDPDRL